MKSENPVAGEQDARENILSVEAVQELVNEISVLRAQLEEAQKERDELRAFNQSLHGLIRRVWEALEPTGQYEGDEDLVQFAKSIRVAKDSAEWSRDGLLFRAEAAESRWIPVSERLPGIGQRAWIVINGYVQVMPAHFNGEEWEWLDEDADPAPKEAVSHWQNYPLPEPPIGSPDKETP